MTTKKVKRDVTLHPKDLEGRATTSICPSTVQKKACSCLVSCPTTVTKYAKTVKEKTTETSYDVSLPLHITISTQIIKPQTNHPPTTGNLHLCAIHRNRVYCRRTRNINDFLHWNLIYIRLLHLHKSNQMHTQRRKPLILPQSNQCAGRQYKQQIC